MKALFSWTYGAATKGIRRHPIIGSAILITLFGCLALSARYVRGRLNEPLEFRTVNVEHRDLRLTIKATGTIEPDEVIEVGPETSGRILQFGRDEASPDKSIGVGSHVRRGTVLFEIDRSTHDIAVERALAAQRLAESELARLEAVLQQANRGLQRAERLRATNAEREFDDVATARELALAQFKIGQARVEQASVELKHAQFNLKATTVRAPTDGVVVDRRANLGQFAHSGQPGLFLLAKDLNRMRIRASVSESDIGKLKIGQTVTFSVDAHRDKTLTGIVNDILLNARMHGNFVTYDVMVAIDKSDITLFPNMTADVDFEIIKRPNAWLVPNAAVQWRPEPDQIAQQPKNEDGTPSNDLRCVWIPAGAGRVRPLTVKVGIDDGVVTEVTGDGFREGIPVVVGVIKKTSLARIIPSAKTIR